MTDFTWNISFQLTGTYEPADRSFSSFPVTATVTGTIVTDSDSGILQQSDFVSYAFTYAAPAVGFSGSASGTQLPSIVGNIFSASGDTLSYVFDPVAPLGAYAFFGAGPGDPSQVAFGIDLNFANFVQGDIRLQDALFDQLDGAVPQPFQIGTEVVATLADVSVIGTSQIDLDLSAIFNVAGNVTISGNDQLVSIDLSHLLGVGGDFTLTNNGALLTISLPSLTTVTGSVNVTDDASLGVASLGSLTTVTGSVDVSNDPSLTSLGTDSLTTTGSVNVTGDASLGVVNLSSLTTVTGSVDVSGDTSAITVDLSALLSAGAIIVSDNGVVTLDLSALVIAGGDVSITDNTHLLTVDLPSLSSTGGSVDISGDTSATHVNLEQLDAVGGNLTISGDTSATSVNLGSMTSAGGDVTISGDTSATSVNLDSMTSAGGDVTISGDASATSVSLDNMTSAGGDVTVSGDNSATSVNLGSLDTVGGNVTITSGADAALDASLLGPGGGTVKLIGDNLTTSITLGSLDHLGGTLTISSADGVTLTSHAGLSELDITGTAHNDVLIGSATAANVINAGAGNDTMSGGATDDSFVFDFSVSEHMEFHHDFVSLANITSVEIGSSIYFKPAPTASITAWQVWDNALTTYANNQADNTGGDQFTAFTNSNPVAKNDGTIKLIDGYFHDYNAPVADLAGSGFDTITNFANHALSGTSSGGGNDGLLFDGLSGDQTALNYWGNWLSSTTANGNTTIDFHDVAHNGADIASITLTGVTTDVATLVQDGIIKFGTLPVSDWHV